jgi:hypothetical protein
MYKIIFLHYIKKLKKNTSHHHTKHILHCTAQDYVCFLEFIFQKITFQTFMCLFVIRKVGQRKTFSSQRKIWLGFQESVFLKNLGGKHFPEVVKNLKISYYLLIISNLVFNCYIYFVLNIYFSISSLKI